VWTVVYIAPSKAMAEMLKGILVKEGLLCMLKSLGIPHAGDAASFEILVPEVEAEEAHEILSSVLGG